MIEKRFLSIFLLVTLTFFTACEDRDDGPLFDFAWDQTRCADPWGTGENSPEPETEAALGAYLADQGIEFQEISFLEDSDLDTACEACECGTGMRIVVTVGSGYIAPLQELGFYLK